MTCRAKQRENLLGLLLVSTLLLLSGACLSSVDLTESGHYSCELQTHCLDGFVCGRSGSCVLSNDAEDSAGVDNSELPVADQQGDGSTDAGLADELSDAPADSGVEDQLSDAPSDVGSADTQLQDSPVTDLILSDGNDAGEIEIADQADLQDTAIDGTPDGEPGDQLTPSCLIYVDKDIGTPGDGTSWKTAIKSLQGGIDAASLMMGTGPDDRCDVWVKHGTYYIYNSEDKFDSTVDLATGVHLYGGFNGTESQRGERNWQQNKTTLHGTDGQSDSNRVKHVVTALSGTRLDGFYVVGGKGTSSNGSGMRIVNRVDVTVENCFFVQNEARQGGAVFVSDSDSVRFVRTMFVNNTAEYGSALYITVSDQNKSFQTTILDSVFVGNTTSAAPYGQGTVYSKNGGLTLERSIFAGNSSDSGNSSGLYTTNVQRTFVINSVFVGNITSDQDATYGGAITTNTNSETVDIINCTISKNLADTGGGIHRGSGLTILTNSIVWGNTGGDIGGNTAWITTSYSNVGITMTGEKNLSKDPKFRDVPPQGVWSKVQYIDSLYFTELTDSSASWKPGALKGLFVRPSDADPRWYLIKDNNEQTIVVWGDVVVVPVDAMYTFFDPRLKSDSPCRDSGTSSLTPQTDIEGNPRNGQTDMGAYEFQ